MPVILARVGTPTGRSSVLCGDHATIVWSARHSDEGFIHPRRSAHLFETQDGFHVVRMRGSEVLRTRSRKAAAARFNELRRNLEAEYPAAAPSREDKAELFRKANLDAMLSHNSLGGRKKKTTAGGTRTFGG